MVPHSDLAAAVQAAAARTWLRCRMLKSRIFDIPISAWPRPHLIKNSAWQRNPLSRNIFTARGSLAERSKRSFWNLRKSCARREICRRANSVVWSIALSSGWSSSASRWARTRAHRRRDRQRQSQSPAPSPVRSQRAGAVAAGEECDPIRAAYVQAASEPDPFRRALLIREVTLSLPRSRPGGQREL